MQAGHCVAKAQGNVYFFMEDDVHPQCYRCNINLGGNGVEYYIYMVDRYGQERVDEIRGMRDTVVKFTIPELEEIEAKYKARVEEMELWQSS